MFSMFLLYLLLIVASAIWGARLWWSHVHNAESWPRRSPPRLIVAPLIQLALIVVSFLWYGIAFNGAIGELRDTTTAPCDDSAPITAPVDESTTDKTFDVEEAVFLPTLMVTALLVVLSLVYEHFPRNVLHILMAIVTHFYRPSEGFPIRRRIEARFREVFTELLAQVKPTHVTVLAHSQGTIFALSVLANSQWGPKLNADGSPVEVNLVTLGSPFTHIYQHYFPQQYLPLDSPHFSELRSRLNSWVNIFRVDDYVGTHIDGATGDLQTQTFPANIALDGGGHTDYWKADVLGRIAELLPGRP
jgi:hypothetical protein